MSNRYGGSFRNGNGNGSAARPDADYDPFGDGYGSDRFAAPARQPNPRRTPLDSSRGAGSTSLASRAQRVDETNAERQISQVLELIKAEWPAMVQNDCIPVSLALQLLDNSSVGRAHEYRDFKKTHQYLQDSLKNIVHEHHQGFNSSIGTFHKIQGSIQSSQKRVRHLKDSLTASRTNLCITDPELKKLYRTSQMYDDVLQTLNELEDLRTVPDQLEARISEKRFLTAVEVLQNALRKLRRPELDGIGALSDLRSYLANQETALMDILIEELHEHLYLKSPYCQERWQNLAKNQGAYNENYNSGVLTPFHLVLDTMDLEQPVTEDPAKNPESDTFYYVSLVVESLNKLGRLESVVDTLKQRLPVELFSIVNETINEVDQRHPSSLRGGSGNTQGLQMYGSRETQMRADVIYDLLWTLFGKFEAIAEGHRVFHEAIKALIRREGAGNNSTLLGSFRELWNLYQNEIRALLHNYVTTDADLYQFQTSVRQGGMLNGGMDTSREHLFKFSEADPKSVEMTTEYEALDSIIRAAVPGLTSASRKTTNLDKRAAGREARKSAYAGAYDRRNVPGSYKSLVEPSVFNMSLLLPPTLVFLQRLKAIVPPGSDLAASTLTSFLDNFLVNVFQPQLDETLSKLSDSVFGETDSFQQDPDWALVARRPIFKGTAAFFAVITAFCRMLGTIPHDQALSSLIISQMVRYYDRCFIWFKSLVAKAQEPSTAPQSLRYSAELAIGEGDLQETVKRLWASDELEDDLIEKEVVLLIKHANERSLEPNDVIQDRDVISSLCLLYTSMKWLSVRIVSLRHITHFDTDSSRPTLPRNQNRRWTLLNDPSKANNEQQGPVYLPMTQETVQSFDNIVSAFEEFAGTVLLTLHMEIRCRILQSLGVALSPKTAPYVLGEQEIKEPDPQILSLNAELIAYDETVVRFLRDSETAFVRTGLGLLVKSYLVTNASATQPMNMRGCERMQLNILVLQQNLKNIEAGVDLARAANYFSLFQEGPDRIVEKAKRDKERETSGGATLPESERFTYDELRALIELCFSEQLADPERGVASAAKRQMGEKMLALSESMWQS